MRREPGKRHVEHLAQRGCVVHSAGPRDVPRRRYAPPRPPRAAGWLASGLAARSASASLWETVSSSAAMNDQPGHRHPRGGAENVERAGGVALHVVQDVGRELESLTGARVHDLHGPVLTPLHHRMRRPALDAGDGGPGDQRTNSRIGRRLQHGDAPAPRVADHPDGRRAVPRRALPGRAHRSPWRHPRSSAVKVSRPNRSGQTSSPRSSTPLPLRLNVMVAKPARASRSASGGNIPQSLNPFQPWTTTIAGRGGVAAGGADVDQDLTEGARERWDVRVGVAIVGV